MNPFLRNPSAYQRTPLRAELPTPKAVGDGVVTLRLYDPIDSWGEYWGISAKEFVTVLDGLPDDTEQIRLLINSPGGEIWEGLAILNALRNHPARVVAVVEGIAASSASFIAAGVDELHVVENSELFVHCAWGGCIGNAAYMAKAAADLAHEDRNLASVYAGKAGGTVEEWLVVMAEERFYSAEEAVEAGLADKVIKPTKDNKDATTAAKARFDLSVFAKAGQKAPTNRVTEPAPQEPQTPANEPAQDALELPAAEPEPTTEPKEDPVSTLSDDLRSRLGLADDADEAAILAAVDAVQAKADTPPAPDPELVAAAAENANLAEKVTVLTEQVENMSTELAATKAERATAAKAAVFDAAVKDGKIKPADRQAWEARYDKAPDVITDVLASIAAGTAVPVNVTGETGTTGPDPDSDADWDAALAHLDGPTASKKG